MKCLKLYHVSDRETWHEGKPVTKFQMSLVQQHEKLLLVCYSKANQNPSFFGLANQNQLLGHVSGTTMHQRDQQKFSGEIELVSTNLT